MRPWHIVVVALVFFLLFFGIPKLPELARSLGRSLRIFKSETKDLLKDDVRDKADAQAGGSEAENTKEENTTKSPLIGDVIPPKKNREKQ